MQNDNKNIIFFGLNPFKRSASFPSNFLSYHSSRLKETRSAKILFNPISIHCSHTDRAAKLNSIIK